MRLHEVRDDVDFGTGVIDREREEIRTNRPPMYNVVLNNDEYTPAEGVIIALREVFALSESAAIQAMMAAHNHGKAMIGTFTREIAESKIAKAEDVLKKVSGEMSQLSGEEIGGSSQVFTMEPAE